MAVMRQAWKLGRFFGVDTYVHATFLLLLAALAVISALQGAGWVAISVQVLFLLAVFASVVLHELGHALVARIFGIGTRQIVLWPIGGVAQLEGIPRNGRAEMWIAAAGPFVSFVLAGGFALFSMILPASWVQAFIGQLAIANLMLAAFNLLPAFPSDGGRIFRGWLARRLPFVDATGIAVKVGKVMAIALGVLGLLGHPTLLLVAGFLYFAGRQELVAVRGREPSWSRLWAQLRNAVRQKGHMRRSEADSWWGRGEHESDIRASAAEVVDDGPDSNASMWGQRQENARETWVVMRRTLIDSRGRWVRVWQAMRR